MDDVEVWRVIDAERSSLAELFSALSAAEWEHPSLCAGWRIRDVAAHLSLAPRISVAGALVAFARARGDFNRMVRDTALREARLPVADLVTRLRSGVGIHRLAPGQKLNDALLDVLVHGQDVAVALGRVRPMPLDAAVVAADHVWRMGFPFHARRRLRGLRLVAGDITWSAGSGTEVSGPIDALLLLLTGRTISVPRLRGPGAAEVARRTAGWSARAEAGSP
jgi:uncharacterized protein (TIGR03083 family)